MAPVAYTPGPEICQRGGKGVFFPRQFEWEHTINPSLRFVIYFAGLLWCFVGVAIIADVFMGAIEKITSQRALVKNAKTGKMMTIKIWNATVANLTLMALGSSAPEILLAVCEVFSNNFFSGDLGPSTIVGSAAFNLFCISAVCVAAIPNGEVRYIKDTKVFAVTAFFSIFAYLWLLFILSVTSPNVVEVWESVVTFLYFPLLVLLAYLADVNFFRDRDHLCGKVLNADVSKEELAIMEMKVRLKHGMELTDEQVLAIIKCEFQQHSRAMYRVAATRLITRGKKVATEEALSRGKRQASMASQCRARVSQITQLMEPPVVVQFDCSSYAIVESVGTLEIPVKLKRDHYNGKVTVKYKTVNGTAEAGKDYHKVEDVLIFNEGEDQASFKITIINDDEHESTEEFYVELEDPKATDDAHGSVPVKIGKRDRVTVIIVDDDMPGQIGFELEQKTVEEKQEPFLEHIKIVRKHGCCGKVSCSYEAQDGSAYRGYDYECEDGTITFEEGQLETSIQVGIKPKGRYEDKECFRLVLKDPQGGATFDKDADGGSDEQIMTIFIQPSEGAKDRVDKVMRMFMNWDQATIGHTKWLDQFTEAIFCNGSWEEQTKASPLDWAIHIASFPWKLLFAFVPPCDYLNGWVCFFCALAMIGVVTIVIGDMANLVGCVARIENSITAITIVALGTSLPDTFASRTAAQQDPYADAAIGNITGSNAVNVFLGLGLPWSIAAIYWNVTEPNDMWRQKNKKFAGKISRGFVVDSDGLALSVTVFSVCALICIAVLEFRRAKIGGELGGQQSVKLISAAICVSFWIIYIGVSIWDVTRPK